jgi:polyisoprenoid-binding protein YceI
MKTTLAPRTSFATSATSATSAKSAPAVLAVLAVAASLASALPAAAQQATWSIDPTHSEVGFRVKHLVISKVPGKFTKFEGTITADPKAPTAAAVDLKIDVTSISTADEKRDGHLKSPEFFDAAKFPTMTFKSTKIVATGKDAYDVTGDLTLKGVTKPVTLAVRSNGFVKDPWGNDRAGFEVTGKLNRRDFGINFSAVLEAGGAVVSDEVELLIGIEAIKKVAK